MKKLDIRVLILSRGRANSITTTKLLPEWVEVLVPESQADDYRAKVKNPVITTPDDVIGLGALRNWVLDNFKEHTVIMCDDDINYFYRLTGEKTQRVSDPEEVMQILINTCVMARDAGAKMFGFSQTDIRKYKGYEPFALCCWIGTIVGVNGRKYRFRNDKYKVDIDYTLQNLLVERIIWMDSRYYASNNKDNNMGGNAQFRNEDEYNRSIETLKDKWGDCIKVRNYQSQKRISLNFSRKQALKYD